MSFTSLLGSPAPMLEAVFAHLTAVGIGTAMSCDHICYRVATQARYQHLKTALQAFGELASEVPIAGRMISIIHLHQPYLYQGQAIDCLELPAPKPGKAYAEGWEHTEFVVPEKLVLFMGRHPAVAFETGALAKAHNPEIGLRVNDAYQAKFHEAHILDVIRAEKADPSLLRP